MRQRRLQIFLVFGMTILLGLMSAFDLPLNRWWTAVLRNVYALALLLSILFITAAVGKRILALLRLDDVEDVRIHSVALGLGCFGMAYFILGNLGFFSLVPMLILVMMASVWSWPNLLSDGLWCCFFHPLSEIWRHSSRTRQILLLMAFAVLTVGCLQALVLPWGYDALMYHLNAPKLYLEQGRISAFPELWQANGPMLLQMIYALGLAAGSDVFAKLLHLSIGVMLTAGTYTLARRSGSPQSGWLAVGLLLGTQALPLWSSFAYTDVAWALFAFLAVDAFLRWENEQHSGWLILSAAMTAFALGTKYLAMGLLGGLGFALLLRLYTRRDTATLSAAARWSGVAIVLASPWYVRNWLELGNPVFPFFFGGEGWELGRVEQLLTYMRSFGGRAAGEGLRVFWSIFFRPDAYQTVGLERMNPLLLAAGLAFLPSKRMEKRTLSAVVLVECMVWWFSTQQIRLLLPIVPLLSVLGALGVEDVLRNNRRAERWWRGIDLTLAVSVAITLFVNLAVVLELQFPAFILGRESEGAFLERVVYDYQAMQVGLAELDEDEYLLMLWNGQGYYCGSRCLPDADQAAWLNLQQQYDTHQAIAAALEAENVAILLVGKGDAAWMIAHDTRGMQRVAWDDFRLGFVPTYTELLYEDGSMLVLRLKGSDSLPLSTGLE